MSSITIVSTFIVQASFTIITYDLQNMFIIQATVLNFIKYNLISLKLSQSQSTLMNDIISNLCLSPCLGMMVVEFLSMEENQP